MLALVAYLFFAFVAIYFLIWSMKYAPKIEDYNPRKPTIVSTTPDENDRPILATVLLIIGLFLGLIACKCLFDVFVPTTKHYPYYPIQDMVDRYNELAVEYEYYVSNDTLPPYEFTVETTKWVEQWNNIVSEYHSTPKTIWNGVFVNDKYLELPLIDLNEWNTLETIPRLVIN